MDDSLKDPKRLLQRSPSDPRPTKRHSPSESAIPSPDPSYRSLFAPAIPRSTNMPPTGVDFTYFHDLSDSEDNLHDPDLYRDASYVAATPSRNAAQAGVSGLHLPSSDPVANHHPPPYFPGQQALDTLDMYQDSVSDQEHQPADESPPVGFEAVFEAAARTATEQGSTPPSTRKQASRTRSSPPNQESRSAPASENDSHNSSIDLTQLPPQQRQELYEGHLNRTVRLQDLAPPAECNIYPELADEIFAAYQEHTTFTVKLWANYDSYTGKLYSQPSRMSTCGKLQLSDKQRKYMNTFEDIQLSHVVLEIGNPFRTLFEVHLTAINGKLDVRGFGSSDVHGAHPVLKRVVIEAMERIEEDGITDEDQCALTLKDLDLIAKEFVYTPKTQREVWECFVN